MSKDSILMQRHSSRKFSDKKVDQAILMDILNEAQQAPTWENSQPWKIYLAMGESAKKIRKSHEIKVGAKEKSWTEITPPLTWGQYPQDNINDWERQTVNFLGDKGMAEFRMMNSKLFNSPAIIYITIPKVSSNYSAYDAGALGYGITLSAIEHGLGAIPAFEFVRFPKEIHEHFEIPENESILMGIGVGYTEDVKLNEYVPVKKSIDDVIQIRD